MLYYILINAILSVLFVDSMPSIKPLSFSWFVGIIVVSLVLTIVKKIS